MPSLYGGKGPNLPVPSREGRSENRHFAASARPSHVGQDVRRIPSGASAAAIAAAIDPRAEISLAGLPLAARPTSGFSPGLPSAAGDRYRSSQRSSKRDPL